MNILEALGINRDEEWFDDTDKIIRDIIDKSKEMYVDFQLAYIEECFPELKKSSVERTVNFVVADFCLIFFHLGFYEGLIEGEKREERNNGLKKLLGDTEEKDLEAPH